MDNTDILKQRAKKLALNPDKIDIEDKISIVKFFLGAEEYAIETKYIKEVYKYDKITKVPGTPSFIIGIVNIRGEIYCVNNIFEILGMGSIIDNSYDKIMLLKNDNLEFGILLKDLGGEVMISTSKIQTAFGVLQIEKKEYIKGVLSCGTIVLDLNNILNDESLIVNESY